MKLPRALTHYDNWKAVRLAGPMRALILSDLHVPYHSEKSVELAVEYGRQRSANVVFLNGDLCDFFALSSWEKDPRKRDLRGEVDAGRQLLHYLRDRFPRARFVFKEGNHEERWQRFMMSKASDFLNLPEFEWKQVYGLAKLRVRHIAERRPVHLGKLVLIHGHEYRFNISNPVNPARGLFLRGKTHALCGHFHQTSQHSEKRLDDRVISTWSTGCLCDLHPDYAPLNNWNHGFAFADITSTGAFEVNNLRIFNGRVWA